jgi:hypothetical protein
MKKFSFRLISSYKIQIFFLDIVNSDFDILLSYAPFNMGRFRLDRVCTKHCINSHVLWDNVIVYHRNPYSLPCYQSNEKSFWKIVKISDYVYCDCPWSPLRMIRVKNRIPIRPIIDSIRKTIEFNGASSQWVYVSWCLRPNIVKYWQHAELCKTINFL